MNLALLGFGNVGRAFARLLEAKRSAYPFRITGVQTRRLGAAVDPRGLGTDPRFSRPALPVDEFLAAAQAEILVEVTTLEPASGEPAIGHIRAAFARGLHVVTANKGPIAHAYRSLCEEAKRRGAEFRFESTCMDGAPVFNLVRQNLPGVQVQGFTGALNSTTKVVVDAMRDGLSMEEGIARAQTMGIAEADASYDIDGWDAAAKTAALANVLLDARVTPLDVRREGIGGLTPAYVQRLAAERKTVVLICRGSPAELSVRPEVLDETDVLAAAKGTSNLLLFHTDLMGTVGTISIDPGVEQTAYGIFSDVVDIARSL